MHTTNIPEIKDITLLSCEEAKHVLKIAPDFLRASEWYWTRSINGNMPPSAALIRYDGIIYNAGDYAYLSYGVRPVLIIEKPSTYEILDEFKINNYTFTIISENLALMNDVIKDTDDLVIRMWFDKSRKNYNFENSDIKYFLDDFLHNKLLTLDTYIKQGMSFKKINKILNGKNQENDDICI